MGEHQEIIEEFYNTLRRFHNSKPKFKGDGDLANVEFFMLMGLSVLIDMKNDGEQKKDVTLGDIMRMSGMSVSAASKKISILEKKGYIHRETSKTDRRSISLKLTEKGKEICEEEKKKKRIFIERLITEMGDENMKLLLELSNRAFDIMENMDCSEK